MERNSDGIPSSLEECQNVLIQKLGLSYLINAAFTEVVDDQLARVQLIKQHEGSQSELNEKLYEHAEMVRSKCGDKEYHINYVSIVTLLAKIQSARLLDLNGDGDEVPGTNPLYLASEYADNYLVNQIDLLKQTHIS